MCLAWSLGVILCEFCSWNWGRSTAPEYQRLSNSKKELNPPGCHTYSAHKQTSAPTFSRWHGQSSCTAETSKICTVVSPFVYSSLFIPISSSPSLKTCWKQPQKRGYQLSQFRALLAKGPERPSSHTSVAEFLFIFVHLFDFKTEPRDHLPSDSTTVHPRYPLVN